MSENTIFLTQDGYQKLVDELDYLKNIRRVEIAEKLKEAISFWDLSENAEYEEARSEQAQVEMRIVDLEEQLKNVQIIKEDKTKKEDKVMMGTTVTLLNIEEDEKQSYKIVGSTESSILADMPRISNESLIGKALLGKKKWDTVKVKAPAGSAEYKILDLK